MTGIVINIIEYEELDSTNNEAKRLIVAARTPDAQNENIPYGTVIKAKYQTAGRGRIGRSFFSPGPPSIYASFVLPPPARPAEQLITALAAVAVCEAIERTTSYKPGIKWINDVLADGKKICGILAESIPEAVILGIGININIEESDMPKELRAYAGSLRLDEEETAGLFGALVDFVFRFTAAEGKEAASLMDEYRKRSVVTGKKITIIQGESKRPATALDISDDGALVVAYEDGSVGELRTGEISIFID